MTYRILVFNQTLIKATQTDKEQYARNILEAVYPLSPFTLLTTNIHHQHFMIPQIESRFRDTDRPSPSMYNILL